MICNLCCKGDSTENTKQRKFASVAEEIVGYRARPSPRVTLDSVLIQSRLQTGRQLKIIIILNFFLTLST